MAETKTTIIGCGRWASFLSWYCLRLGHQVMIYGRTGSARFQSLESTLQNEYLTLKGAVHFTSEVMEALKFSDTLLVSIEAQQWRSFCQVLKNTVQEHELAGKTFVLCMKGLDNASGLRLSEVFEHVVGLQSVAVWLGPGHVQDFLSEKPNCMVMDSNDTLLTQQLVQRFDSDLIRFYLGNDLLGNEIGAAAKNVIGIAAGLLDGSGLTPLKGALMSRGAFEIASLIQAMGGAFHSAYGLAHLGDYQATLFSEHSHNRRFGEAFVKGESFERLAEGVGTLEVLLRCGWTYKVDLPICEAVDLIINQQQDPQKVLCQLLARPVTVEFD